MITIVCSSRVVKTKESLFFSGRSLWDQKSQRSIFCQASRSIFSQGPVRSNPKCLRPFGTETPAPMGSSIFFLVIVIHSFPWGPNPPRDQITKMNFLSLARDQITKRNFFTSRDQIRRTGGKGEYCFPVEGEKGKGDRGCGRGQFFL